MSRAPSNNNSEISSKRNYTACLAFSTGECFFGYGFGSEGLKVGELCFNTSMTGYQEILTDLSYAGQIVNFTFPHIGNTGTNVFDSESKEPAALGMVCRNLPTKDSSWRSDCNFSEWLAKNGIIGIGQIDTRRVTRLLRLSGAQSVAISYSKSGQIDIKKLKRIAKEAKSLIGVDLSMNVTCLESYAWNEQKISKPNTTKSELLKTSVNGRIIAVDYGAKQAIFRQLASMNHEVLIVPADTPFADIIKLNPNGVFLSNGPGDPLATFHNCGKTIIDLVTKSKLPIFGICLGHQLLGLALGASTIKMPHGHHGANHPVKNLITGKVEITSMNHGFAIDKDTLPNHVLESHVSLFDGSNCGIEIPQRNIFSVQYHPEAHPGPQDSYYLFKKFFDNIMNVNSDT